LIDRIRFGPVTDFISVGSFPVFNIADSSITVGVGLLILALWLAEQRERRENKADKSSDQLNVSDTTEAVHEK
jgi:signal peptidase II